MYNVGTVCVLVETTNRGFQHGEIGPFVGIFHPASLHHLDDFLVADVVVDRRPERWLVSLRLSVLDVSDDFYKENDKLVVLNSGHK